MTDEVLFNFDFEGVAEVDEPTFVIIKDFGQFQIAAKRQVTLFQAGQQIVIPEIVVNGQPFSRKGMKEGGKITAYFLTRVGEKQDGSEFTEVRIFTSIANIPHDKKHVDNLPVKALNERQQAAYDKGETVWLSDWSNMQVPAIQAMTKEQAADFGRGKPVWASADNWNTGRKPNVVNEGTEAEKKYYERFWFNFVIYPTKEVMIAAREAHFAGLNGNTTGVMWPKNWLNSLDAMKDYAKKVWTETGSWDEVQKKLNLTPELEDEKGNPVDVEAILNALTDTAF